MLFSCGKKKKKEKITILQNPILNLRLLIHLLTTLKEVKVNLQTVELGAALDQAMATKGEEVAGVKCTSCHKPTDEKLVGPGMEKV